MADSPPIAGYAGTFSGSPVTINPWTDHGFVSNQTILIPTGAHGLTVTMGANTLQVPAGVILSIPGALNSFILNGMATEGWIAYCAGQPIAGLVSAIFGGGSGGGGGGGAPSKLPYLVDMDSVDSQLPNSIPIRILDAPLEFIQLTDAPGVPLEVLHVCGSDAFAPPVVGGGVRLPLKWVSSSGMQSVVVLEGVWNNATDPAHPTGQLRVYLGADETPAASLTVSELAFAASTEIKGIHDSTAATSAVAQGQFAQGIQHFASGENQHTVSVDAKFNGKAVTFGFAGVPGAAVAATPVGFVGVVTTGTLTISVIDTATGQLLLGGVSNAIDLGWHILAV